jgi:hypothetical protein
MNIQVQETFRTQSTHNHKRSSLYHKTAKVPRQENKERISKTAKEKCQLTYKGKYIRITSDLSEQTLKGWKVWNDVLSSDRK